MLRVKNIILLAAAMCTISFSCTDNFEELNTDPNLIEKISPGTLLNPILYSVTAFNTSRSNDFTFNIMQVALPFPSTSGGVHRYDITESAGNSTWTTYYKWLTNVKEMLAASVEANDPNYEAIALTLNAWIYSLLTDCFGDVPVVEAARGDEGILQPAFNTQQEVYTKILADLERANTLFDPAKPLLYGSEILYSNGADNIKDGNNIKNWRRFCNSLHLRLLLRISKRTEMNAFTKLATMINDPVTYPVFSSNAEAAILKVTGVEPNVSPWGRAIDFTTFRAAGEFFVNNLNDFNDPRRAIFNTQARSKDGKTTIGYKGIPSAYAGSDSQFDFLPSNHNIALVTAPMVCVIMTYAEVEFIKAELAQQGVIATDAQMHYEAGVRAAIDQWGAEVPTNYFDTPAAAYDGTLERIMLQKYYALYFNDYQQWFEYRRTGFPVLPTTDAMLNDKKVPVRFEYPVVVQTNNQEGYAKALESMGGDDINTKVWWEK
jgi:hypothetical protein